MNNRTLYIFVNHFPYSTQENFLADELPFLAKEFKKITILPMCGEGKMRPVPENCEVMPPLNLTHSRICYFFKGLFSFRSFYLVLSDFFKGKAYSSNIRLHNWISSVLQYNNLLHSRIVKCIIDNCQPEDIMYSYWGTDLVKIALMNKKKCKFVSRFHGAWDLWEESYDGYIPFRAEVVKNIKLAVFISKKGEKYFKQKYPDCNTAVCPLGSVDQGICLPKPNDNVIRVVSCSTVYPLKRVPLIFQSLLSIKGLQIEWTHIGSGSHYSELRRLVNNTKHDNIKVNLLGSMSHDEVMDYYKSHYFDVFVNLSTSEGVPVSIMEAMSFGIPIVATNVGSTSDEVVPLTGVLVSPNPSEKEVADAIIKIVDNRGKYNPRVFWNDNYNAELNYHSFTTTLVNL